MVKKPVSLEIAVTKSTTPQPIETGAPRPETIKLTVYLPKAVGKRRKLMAVEEGKTVNDFLREGVDMVLRKYGQGSIGSAQK